MATNRPYDLDEAMHRRIMIAVEFRQPDHLLRKAIWRSHIPDAMKLGDDFDLVGGLTIINYCLIKMNSFFFISIRMLCHSGLSLVVAS